jgi:asparagine synthase (glutamine-hydrolysing)
VVARHFGTEHTEFVVRPDAAALIDRLVEHHDQPFGDSSALPTYLLCELTRRDVKVALCGDGGDEVFAGYERFGAAMALSKLQLLPAGARDGIAKAFEQLPPALLGQTQSRLRRFLDRRDLPPHRALLSWVSYTPDDWRARLRPGACDWGFAHYERLWEGSAGLDLLGRLQAVTIASYLLDDLLVKVDRMSMAHALEVRSPFLDADLVAFGLSLPSWDKAIGPSLKRMLKKTMAGTLPPEILRRPKRGFGLPLDRWFRTDLRGYVEGTLGVNSARVRGHLNPEALDVLLAEHMNGQAGHGHLVWTLLTLEAFLRREGW